MTLLQISWCLWLLLFKPRQTRGFSACGRCWPAWERLCLDCLIANSRVPNTTYRMSLMA
jgi:hypothetical protein